MLAVACRLRKNYPQQGGRARSKPLLRLLHIHSNCTVMVPSLWTVMVILSVGLLIDTLPVALRFWDGQWS